MRIVTAASLVLALAFPVHALTSLAPRACKLRIVHHIELRAAAGSGITKRRLRTMAMRVRQEIKHTIAASRLTVGCYTVSALPRVKLFVASRGPRARYDQITVVPHLVNDPNCQECATNPCLRHPHLPRAHGGPSGGRWSARSRGGESS